MQKAPKQSKLSKNNMGALEENNQTKRTQLGDLTRRDMTRLIEQICHKGANRKWAARTCTRHPSGHNLAKLIRAPSNETTQPKRARSGDLA